MVNEPLRYRLRTFPRPSLRRPARAMKPQAGAGALPSSLDRDMPSRKPLVATPSGADHANAAVQSALRTLDTGNTQTMPSWTRFDLGASYATRIGGMPASVLLNVENVADKSYWASAQGGILTMADPLTVKLGVRLSF